MKYAKLILLFVLLLFLSCSASHGPGDDPGDDPGQEQNPDPDPDPDPAPEPTYPGDILVALDGTGDFTKIQDAINSVDNNKATRTVIFLKKGVYNTEKLIIPANKTNITIQGEDRDETIISYHMYHCGSTKCPEDALNLWKSNSELMRYASTLMVYGNGFVAEDLTFENTAGPVGQAQAVTIGGDRSIFRRCTIKGYQDTLYLYKGGKYSYFENCLIVGRTDYIYGSGIGFFEGCEIRSYGGGHITAPATLAPQAYGFVFHKCKLTYTTGSPNSGDDGQKFALGRPWNDSPKVAWFECEMPAMLDPLGWNTKWEMADADTRTDLHLYEYDNTGPGADMSGRADWRGIRVLTAAEAANYTVEKVLGYDPATVQ